MTGRTASSEATGSHARAREAPPRLALTREEAAASIGVSVDAFDDYVRPQLRTVYLGRRRIYPVAELERFLDREAVRA